MRVRMEEFYLPTMIFGRGTVWSAVETERVSVRLWRPNADIGGQRAGGAEIPDATKRSERQGAGT